MKWLVRIHTAWGARRGIGWEFRNLTFVPDEQCLPYCGAVWAGPFCVDFWDAGTMFEAVECWRRAVYGPVPVHAGKEREGLNDTW